MSVKRLSNREYRELSYAARVTYDNALEAEREQERAEERRNEVMTRGAILEAIDGAAILTEHDGQLETLRLLRKVFE